VPWAVRFAHVWLPGRGAEIAFPPALADAPRDSRQLPVARIQAVDVARPFLARALGLAELRVRLAGQAARLVEEFATLSREARRRVSERGVPPVPPAPEVPARPPGAVGTPAQAGPL
jgi:putative membrane protein